VVISLARMNRVLDIDLANRQVTVEPGVTNLENHPSGGAPRLLLRAGPLQPTGVLDWRQRRRKLRRAHCLKYGFHVHHVLEVEAVMPDGELVSIGSRRADAPGPICWP
jgi:glycolate oxidase